MRLAFVRFNLSSNSAAAQSFCRQSLTLRRQFQKSSIVLKLQRIPEILQAVSTAPQSSQSHQFERIECDLHLAIDLGYPMFSSNMRRRCCISVNDERENESNLWFYGPLRMVYIIPKVFCNCKQLCRIAPGRHACFQKRLLWRCYRLDDLTWFVA
jgi:hypothetical protein